MVWQSPRKGEKITAGKEGNKEALEIDVHAVAWMVKRKSKLILGVAGHIPLEISRFIWYFFTHGGKIEATALST